MTPEEVLGVLATGDFEPLVGVAEDESLDFKGQPYRLVEDHQAFELAKDVSALANASGGGALIVGFETERTEGSAVETVAHVRPFPRDHVDENQHLDKISQLVYPLVVGVRVEFFATQENEDRGALAIVVPAQPEDRKYFLVAKEFSGPEGAPGWLIGISIRSFDRNRHLEIGEIHGLIGGGRNIVPRLDEMSAVLVQIDERTLGTEVAGAPVPAEELLERIARGLDELQQEEENP